MIDEQILPEQFYTASDSRSFKSQACVFISYYFRAASRLTSEERQRTIALASESGSTQPLKDDFLTIDFTSFRKYVDEGLRRLHAAREGVVADPEILSGTLVLRGTRVPVYDVAASVAAGIPTQRILEAYPSITDKQVELAAVYAEANPLRGRPRQRPSPPAGARVVTKRTQPIQ
jgi:uncharacterized protein (DUF433 family)